MKNLRAVLVWGGIALCVALILALAVAPSAEAQGRPAEFDLALKDLGTRLGRTLTLADFDNPTSRWEWRGVDFADSSLECPLGGETPVVGKVIGYQFIFVLSGKKYDYRVALAKPETLKLCTNATGAQYDVTLVATNPPRTDPPESLNAALAELNTLLGTNLTLVDFDQVGYLWTWRYREFRNSQLDCPKAGQATDGITTPGWVYVFRVKGRNYEYRVADVDTSNLFLCRQY